MSFQQGTVVEMESGNNDDLQWGSTEGIEMISSEAATEFNAITLFITE